MVLKKYICCNFECFEQEDWVPNITAFDTKEAVEEYCRKRDWDSCDYQSERVVMAKEEKEEMWHKFKVTLRAEPVYTAKEI